MLTLQGGEANTFVSSSEMLSTAQQAVHFHDGYDIVDLPGGDGQLEVAYELRAHNFFIGLTGNAHYTVTGQSLGDFMDEYRCLDVDGTPYDYKYNYNDYFEYQQTFWAGGGLRLGYYISPQWYAAVGVKAEYPLWNSYRTKTKLFTSGYWPFAFGGITSEEGEYNPYYGLFSTEPFEASGQYMTKKKHMIVSPCVEVGTKIKLAGRSSLRLAAYAEYGIPVKPEYDGLIVNYENVHQVPLPDGHPDLKHAPAASTTLLPPAYWQERDQLWNTLQLGSVLDFAGQTRAYNRLCVGVKVVFVLDVTVRVEHCTTCDDDSGIPYHSRSGGKSGSGGNRISGVWW